MNKNNSSYKFIFNLCVIILLAAILFLLLRYNSIFFIQITKINQPTKNLDSANAICDESNICAKELIIIRMLIKCLQNKSFSQEISYLLENYSTSTHITHILNDLLEYSNNLQEQDNATEQYVNNKMLSISKISESTLTNKKFKEKMLNNIEILVREFVFNK